MLALDSGHTIGYISSPYLIGLLYVELPVKEIRNIQVWLIGLLVNVAWRLRTDQPQLLHPSAGTVTAQRYSGLCHHAGNGSCPG